MTDDIAVEHTKRWPTGIDIFDELIGGGLVPGGITLIGGEPGVGKSTFMLQLISPHQTIVYLKSLVKNWIVSETIYHTPSNVIII